MAQSAEPTRLAGTGVSRGHTILIIDADALSTLGLDQQLRDRSLRVLRSDDLQQAIAVIRREGHSLDVVLVNVSRSSVPWLAVLRELRAACERHCPGPKPLLLCFSSVRKDPLFQLQVEGLGARFVHEA